MGAAAAVWPVMGRAQQSPTIGFVNSASPDHYASSLRAFRKGLAEYDYIEGRNVAIEYRWAKGQYDQIPQMTKEMVERNVDVIFANGPAVLSAKAATTKIPIVFSAGFDPIALGLVTSLSRPGGNLTGVSILNTELGPKRIELLRELLPTAAAIALLANPQNPNLETLTQITRKAADALGLQFHVLHAKTDSDFHSVFARLDELHVAALVIGNDPFFTTRAEALAGLALQRKLPAIYQYPEFAISGGLMSYGGSLTDAYYKAGVYVGRILKGDKPGDLPVQQSTKVELIINLKTAKALNLTAPLSLLGRADEVIE
jgi:putative ABC transport system substrate-binding protein